MSWVRGIFDLRVSVRLRSNSEYADAKTLPEEVNENVTKDVPHYCTSFPSSQVDFLQQPLGIVVPSTSDPLRDTQQLKTRAQNQSEKVRLFLSCPLVALAYPCESLD